ncbi:MAG: flagellar basal body rod protein FlgB [Dehalococcoidales bacterium]|nr:flagellar basal body rod protein FlgB [Dehalococcoidales bacterium]
MTDPISGGITDKAIGVALNGLAARQRVISNNLANVDTPQFKASEVRFEDELQNVIGKGRQSSPLMLVSSNRRHINPAPESVEAIQPEVVSDNSTTIRVDGNNVDIDKEMVQLAETAVSYNSLVQLVSARLSLERYIINEGRR